MPRPLNNLAVVLVARADFEQAEAMIRESLETTVAAVGEQDPLAISRLDGLQQVLAKAGRHDEAVDLARRLVDLRLRLLPASDPEAALESGAPADHLANLATALNTLGAAERQAGRYADAERRLQQALSIHREIVGPGHFIVGFDLNNLANVHSNRDRHAAALATRAEALAIAEPALGAAHPAVASIRLNQGYELHRLGRSEEGLAVLGQAREALVAALGAGHPAVALADSYSALAMLGLGRADEAVELQRQALDRHFEHHGAEHSEVARCRAALGEVLAAVGRHEDAAAQFRTAAKVFETTLGPEHPDTLDSRSRGSESLLVLGRTAEARRLLEPVVEALEARGDLPLRLAWARFRLARAMASDVAAKTRAAALAEQAEAAFRESGDTAAAARVEAWLARYR